MPRVPPAVLVAAQRPETSAQVRVRIVAARDVQLARAGALNGRLSGRALRAACGLDRAGETRAVTLAEAGALSARATERLLRVARTIADLDGAARVDTAALEEAAVYRESGSVLGRPVAV